MGEVRSDDGPARRSHVWSQPPEFALVTDLDEPADVTSARILNSDYVSTVKKADAGWAVSELVLNSEEGYARALMSLNGTNTFASFGLVRLVGPTYGTTNTSLAAVLADPANYDVTGLAPDGGQTRLEIAVDPQFQPDDPMRPSKFVVGFNSDHIATLVVVIPEAPGGAYTETYSFDDFHRVGTTELPGSIVLKSDLVPPDEEPFRETTTIKFDYSQFDAPFDTDRCYLTYYGLPEPDGVRQSTWPWYAAGAGLVLVAAWLLRKRKEAGQS